MSKVFEVSRSGYYRFISAKPSQRALDNQRLHSKIYDNAAAESFFHTLKTEHVYFESYETQEQAKQSIFEYILVFYNRKRRHSTLNYVSPVEFENSR